MNIEYYKKAPKIINRAVNFFKRKYSYIVCYDIKEFFLSIKTIVKLSTLDYKSKSVLIIEPNDYHGEIIPGYTYYFNNLNYDVTVLLRRKNYNSGLFNLFDDNEKPNIYCINNFLLKRNKKIFKKFDIVMFTSTMISEKNGYFGHYFNYYNLKNFGRKLTISIEHNFQSLISSIQNNYINSKDVFLLNPFLKDGFDIKMINPNYFGNKLRKFVLNKKTFITVGSISNRNRNFDELINAVHKLNQFGNFEYEIIVIGRNIKSNSFKELPKQIKIVGEVSYEELYYNLQHAHFFLTLLDPKCDGHRRYLEGETTGSRQLIMGFNILPVIQKEFSEVYGFNDSNAFIYEDSLFDGMLKALKSDLGDLEKMNGNIHKLTEKIRDESLFNLESRLNGL